MQEEVTGVPAWHGRGTTIGTPTGPLYFEVEGHGPHVLLVGGGPGNDYTHYHPWFSRLAAERTVVYYDHPGTGRSRPISDAAAYSLESYTNAIEALRIHLGAEELDLIGISFGGLPAVDYAIRFPDRIRSVVLSNAQISAGGWQAGNIDSVNHALRTRFPEAWERIESLRAEGVRSLDPTYQELVSLALPGLEWVDPWHHPELAGSDTAFALEAYRSFIGDDPEWSIDGTLAGFEPPVEDIGCPTLVLCGRHDGLTLPRIAEATADRIPTARLHIFEASSHRPWAEQPDEYFDVVGSFLST